MLEVSGLHAGYGGTDVLRGVSLSVSPRSITAVVGANGAGKSTLLRALSGLLRPSAGSVTVDGRPLPLRSERGIVRAGVVHVPEGRQVFSNLTVHENLELGAYSGPKSAIAERLAEVLGIFPDLATRLTAYAGSLSGGQQQMLAIGRGLMIKPRYLFLDEPSLGLAPQVTEKIFAVIKQLRSNGVGVLLVEQNGRLALSIADHACLLEQGEVTLRGTGTELLSNNSVVERYLGVGAKIGGGTSRHRELVTRLRLAIAG